MADTINQMFDTINDIAPQVMGSEAITVTDLTSFIQFGQTLNNLGAPTVSKFAGALWERVNRLITAVRPYYGETKSLKREPVDWGIGVNKVSYKMPEASENPFWWGTDKRFNPYTATDDVVSMSTVFKGFNTFQVLRVIAKEQLKVALLDAGQLAQFINGIYTTVENKMVLTMQANEQYALSSAVGGIIAYGNGVLKRNVLKEYNDSHGTKLTVAQALESRDFFTFLAVELNEVIKHMRKMSVVYNILGYERHTPLDRVVVNVLDYIDSRFTAYLSANTFHNELIQLPFYEPVSFWQGSGTSFDFDDISTINIKIPALPTSPAGTAGTVVNQSGIIAYVHDIDSVFTTFDNEDTISTYNPGDGKTTLQRTGNVGYCFDSSENGVVFYMEEEPTSGG